MNTLQLNHVALHVADVARSCEFYEQVMRLEPLERPAFSFPGAWFRIGVDQELHLIGGRDANDAANGQSRGNHWAMMVDDMDAWETHLQQRAIAYAPRRSRPDGAFQIFLPDPDGHMIELCTPPSSSPHN
ncbi:MAG: VOC family protein [Planctomycetales bacterium]|nr:VOC family protein [Planctomycetales bacterium]